MVSHDYRVRQCAIDRLSCSSIIAFLVTKKKKRLGARYLKPQVLLWSQDPFDVVDLT